MFGTYEHRRCFSSPNSLRGIHPSIHSTPFHHFAQKPHKAIYPMGRFPKTKMHSFEFCPNNTANRQSGSSSVPREPVEAALPRLSAQCKKGCQQANTFRGLDIANDVKLKRESPLEQWICPS